MIDTAKDFTQSLSRNWLLEQCILDFWLDFDDARPIKKLDPVLSLISILPYDTSFKEISWRMGARLIW
jgi:hypothetical protein